VAPKDYANPIKEAMKYKAYLDSGEVRSQADLARKLGVSRAKVTQMLNLLKLDADIQGFIAELEKNDERLPFLTERKLRHLTRLEMPTEQRACFKSLIHQMMSSRESTGEK
jgi:ParB-like chromosome segregation protein Spo0J